MLAVFALIAAGPGEIKLPAGALAPAAVSAGSVVNIVYGDGKDAYFTTRDQKVRVRINSEAGSVHAGGERGPRIAMAGDVICCAWQGDYRAGPKVWFSRSTDGGETFEPQHNLLRGSTPGIDHVSVVASGRTVAVFWIDGRGGEVASAPTTAEVWYALSTDAGRTFGKERRIEATPPLRACACCRIDPHLTGASATLVFRGGQDNLREIWIAKGDLVADTWKSQVVTSQRWELDGCPMDGPRMAGASIAYRMRDNCYLKDGNNIIDLGSGRYPEVVTTGNDSMVSWQEGRTLHWRFVKGGQSGVMTIGSSRVALAAPPGGPPIVIHGVARWSCWPRTRCLPDEDPRRHSIQCGSAVVH